ncbi:hypothetical protein AWR27_14220 [Spirosoma montaniterrae]|uniref:Uncharacterized protein n=1 Tax=Spirosoma montaniterrae TaxID=1178516 RepID=A0A1P9WYB8_9BACT|nr:hypothetical protein AWR27_14220 [Spirosoma montaniterrae]
MDFSALGGANYGSSVQFVNGNSTNVNFAVHDPNDYNRGPDNTNVFVPCYVNGDPLGGGFAGTQDWFVSYPYSYSGITLAPTKKMGGTVIGAVWGLAYSKQAQKIFSSAFLKRHVGLGQLGTGGIYMIDPNAFTAQPFFDLDVSGYRTRADASAPAYGKGSSYSLVIEAGYAVGVTYLGSVDPVSGLPAGAGVVGTNVQRGLPASGGYVPNYDPAVFDQAGKVGLGDIDISDDGKFLFVTNLYSRKLIRMELDDVRNPQAVIAVESYDLPAINCNNGFLRPWALKYHRGKLYVGALCTGENNGKNIVNGASDMNAYVFELTDPTGAATFNPTPTLEYPLNFQKGGVIDDLDRQWFPWINTISGWNYRFNLMHPQPILSDIEFSDRGDMILGFTDRSGNQMGHNNYKLLDTHGDLIDHSTGGICKSLGLTALQIGLRLKITAIFGRLTV